MQPAQMAAMQGMGQKGGFGGYAPGPSPGFPFPGYGQMPQPGGPGVGQQGPAPGGGMQVPGGGAADGGFSAAYAAWASAYGGQPGFGGQQQYQGAAKGAGGPSEGGKGRGFGKGKGKGKGRGGKSFGGSPMGGYSDEPIDANVDPKRAIEMAQRRAKQRDRSAISQAQRSAQQRFERDLLDRVQGRWADASDPAMIYKVEGSLCSVSSGDNSRVFRNRLSVFGGELCWDARRWWHTLNLSSLPPVGEEVERVEWNPGEGSPPTRPVVWLRAPPEPESADAPQPEAEGGVSMAEAVAEAAVAEAAMA